MKKNIIVVGAFHEMIELAEDNGFTIVGLIDKDRRKSVAGYRVLGGDKDAEGMVKTLRRSLLLITPDMPKIREKLYLHYEGLQCRFATLISKDAHIARDAMIGLGTIVQFGVNVSSQGKVGRFVKLNTGCNVMHDSRIGDFTTIAPNAVILGNVEISKHCYIGANATILPNLRICDKAVIGAGAVVTKDIAKPAIYAGVPARVMAR